MKKIYVVFAALMIAASMFGQNFGILVNGKMYYAGTRVEDFEGFQQYLAHVPVVAGDYLQLCDAGNEYATWAVDLNAASVQGFTRNDNKYDVTTSGCFDFYIKIKLNQDQLYIGPGSAECGDGVDISGGTPGGGGGGDEDDVNYYAMGWINGADAGEGAYDIYDDNYLFVDGKLTIDCQMGSYIAVKDHMGNYYYSRTQTTIADTQVTLEWASGWAGGQKWAIPEGINYIIIRSASYKGNIVLERVDKATYDAYHWSGSQGVSNVQSDKEQSTKVLVEGQLRIICGDKMYDATGRQL